VVIDTSLALSLMVASNNPLTGREREVLRLAAEGLRSTEIAQRLFLSPGTVRNHLSRILTKTDTRNRISALRTAQQRGWF
jgi:two-component system response regulator DesR